MSRSNVTISNLTTTGEISGANDPTIYVDVADDTVPREDHRTEVPCEDPRRTEERRAEERQQKVPVKRRARVPRDRVRQQQRSIPVKKGWKQFLQFGLRVLLTAILIFFFFHTCETICRWWTELRKAAELYQKLKNTLPDQRRVKARPSPSNL